VDVAISFVASASWSESTDDTSYTLQKPTGVASGDIMLAVLGLDLANDGGNSTTVSAPSGWTILADEHSPPNHQMAIMWRTAGSSEPGSWNGTLASGRGPKASAVVAYRGANAIAVDNENTAGSTTSISTGSVTNPTATNWRVVLGAYSSASVSSTLSSNEVTKRQAAENSNVEVGAWDSNGTVAAGSTSRTMSRGAVWESAAVYIAILDAIDGANVDGAVATVLPSLPVVSALGTLSYSATLTATVPLMPVMTAAGIASPPAGTLDTVVMPDVNIIGATNAAGPLDVVAAPVVDIQGETRFFGIRVVTPAAEDRTTRPRIGAVD
jgi:hypothetical protein